MNLLFTCSGRRNYLIDFFKTIDNVKTITCDASIYAPTLYYSDDFFIVPEVYNTDYIDVLLKAAIERNIDAIIPLNDLELPILAENKHRFDEHGIKAIVSDKDVIDLCFDKLATIKFSENLPVKKIPTFLNPDEAIRFRKTHPECSFVIKPRWGTASIGIEYPQDDEELIYQYNHVKNKLMDSFLNKISSSDYENCVLIQKRIIGQEYGIDVVNDLIGNYQATLIRRKIAMRAGETDKAETIYDENIAKVGQEIGNSLRHKGNLDCDLFVDDDGIYLLEMNPRFGGGYPFVHAAGANLPLAIVEWLKGNRSPVGCFHYADNFVSAKVDKIIEMIPEPAGTIRNKSKTSIKKSNVYIIGAGGFGREIESWVSRSEEFNKYFNLKGYLDDNLNVLKEYPSQYKVLNRIDDFAFNGDDYALLGIADPATKENIVNRIKNKVHFLTFISEDAVVGKYVQIGEGSIIAPNCVLSTNIHLGSYVMLNIGTQVGHDTIISDFSSVMANIDISGMVSVGKSVYIGSKATIIPGRKIGNNSKISAGSVIIQDVPEHSFVFGNHAKVIKRTT